MHPELIKRFLIVCVILVFLLCWNGIRSPFQRTIHNISDKKFFSNPFENACIRDQIHNIMYNNTNIVLKITCSSQPQLRLPFQRSLRKCIFVCLLATLERKFAQSVVQQVSFHAQYF